MNNRSITLITKPDFDIPGVIGGLGALTQHKRDFKLASHEEGLKLMKYLDAAGHTSLFECADFGFIFGGTSRVFLAQITRHRVASYTSGSQQYQDHSGFPFVVPDQISDNPEALKEYNNLMSQIDYTYRLLKEMGVDQDQARYVLPGAASNNLYAKFNLREITYAVVPQRICKRNTPESRENVRDMMKCMINAGFGDCLRFAGCACVTKGKCDQGKMACKEGPYKSWNDMVYGFHTQPEKALKDWLEAYTWIQEDGSLDFSSPRVRPQGLAIHPKELSHESDL